VTKGDLCDLYDTGDNVDVDNVDNFMNSVRRISVSKSSRGDFESHEIILDTAAGESIFRDIENFVDLGYGEPIFVDGVNRDGEPLLVDTVGETIFGQAYFSEECSGNILSFANVVDDGTVVYDRARDVFIIQMTDGGDVFEFHRDSQRRIYICDIRAKRRAAVWVTTVSQQAAKYTKREVNRAWKAVEYLRKLGFTAGQLIKHLRAGKIKNAEVTAQDVVRSLDIFGKELSNLKGKSTARKIKKSSFEPLPHNPELQREQELNLDLMFINNDVYVVGVVTPIDYTSVKKVKSKSNNELWRAIQRIKMPVERAGLKVAVLRCDGESAINSDYMEEKLSNAQIILDSTAHGDAVAIVERRIRTIKERVRGIYNTLPFLVCGLLLKWLVQYAVYRINSELKATANDNLSPAERLFNRQIDARFDLKFAFGDYVQVTDEETTNEITERTKGAIALMPAGNREGSWWFYIIQTGGFAIRNKAEKLPMPDEVINILNELAIGEKKKLNKTNDAIHIGIWGSSYADGNIDHAETLDDDPIVQEYQPEFLYPIYDENGGGEHEEEEVIDQINDNVEMNRQDLLDDIFGPDEVFENLDHRGEQEEREVEIVDYRGDELLEELVPDQGGAEEVIFDPAEPMPEPRYNLRPNRAQRGRWVPVHVAARLERREYLKTRSELLRRTYGLNMTIKDGIAKLGYQAILSVVQEIMALYNMKTFEGKDVSKLSEEELKRVITSKTFLKEKYSPENIFIKLKSRLVARELNHDIYENGVQRSPTACTESVFIIAAIAAMEKRAVANIDFPSAFLLAEIPEDAPEILVELNKFETRVLCKIDPSYERFVLKNGKCIVKLKRPLYGTVMAARLWYEKLSGDLLLLGFEKNIQDECVFNRVVNGKQQTLVVHVDDMLITAENEEAIDNIIKQIGEKYNNLSIYRGRKLDYLGMTFDFSENGKVKVTMNGYIQDLLELCNDVEGLAKTPAGNDLFEIDETSELLDDVKKQLFHSIVAKFQYLGKRVRPDLLTAISFLSRRINSARAQDMKKLHRLIRYLRGTSTMGIILQADNYISIYAYVDASYGVHSDLRSQTGCVIGLGCGPVYCKSTAQKINTKSSTEAELVSLSDMTGQIIWTRNFLEGQGYKMPPAKVYQDNMSTIALVRNGKSNNNRTRHIAIRYFFVADKVRAGEISIEYLPTGHMIADILTKPLQGEQFLKLRRQLLNWSE